MSFSATVDPKPTDHREPRLSVAYLDAALVAEMGATVGDAIRITTVRDRNAVVRIAGLLPDRSSGTIAFDRFIRQSLKAHPHEEVTVTLVVPEPADEVVLISTIPLTAGHLEFLRKALKQTVIDEATPLRAGMLIHARLGENLPGIVYEVHDVTPAEAYVSPQTAFVLESNAEHDHGLGHGRPHQHEARAAGGFDATFDDIGGLGEQIRIVREFVELPLVFPELYRQLGITPPRGIIFHGAPGTGKTLLARSVANEVNARFYYIDGPGLVGSYGGETEQNLRNLFGEAARTVPSIVFIDELDAIAPTRGKTGTMADARAVTQLLASMDGLERAEGVIVIGTTNRIESIDPALRRAGRFDRELYFQTPGPAAREEILRVHTREMPLVPEAITALTEIAARCHGYVGADLMELAREAGLTALRRAARDFLHNPSRRNYPAASDLVVTRQDLESALEQMHPASLRESLISYPVVRWDDIGGLGHVKERLREIIEDPLQHPEIFRRLGLAGGSGILLHGPPGTGKTLLAKAAAHECRVNLVAVQGAEIFSQWVGESEEAIRHIFSIARRGAPCVIFFDQLDAIAPPRSDPALSGTTQRVVNQLLAELDGMQELGQVVVLAATNNVSMIDPSLLRPGRFGIHLYVGLPDEDERREILAIHLKAATLQEESSPEPILDRLVAMTPGFSGADLAQLCRAALIRSLRETKYQQPPVLKLERFEEVIEEFGSMRGIADAGRAPSRAPGD